MRGSSALCLWLLLLCSLPAAAQAVPDVRFTDSSPLYADEGHATLTWDLAENTATAGDLRFELQQSPSPDFADDGRVRHSGQGRAYFVSGLAEGDTWFRVRALGPDSVPGSWSEPLAVRVAYPSRTHVLRLVVVGLVVFVATAVSIALGWSGHRERSG